jgi:hypothetical protein
MTLKGPLHKHASLVVNPGLTFGMKTNTWSPKYPQNISGEESEQIESYEETVAKMT